MGQNVNEKTEIDLSLNKQTLEKRWLMINKDEMTAEV